MVWGGDILQNAQFRSQISKTFFASGGKGALTPLTKFLRTPLGSVMLRSDGGGGSTQTRFVTINAAHVYIAR